MSLQEFDEGLVLDSEGASKMKASYSNTLFKTDLLRYVEHPLDGSPKREYERVAKFIEPLYNKILAALAKDEVIIELHEENKWSDDDTM